MDSATVVPAAALVPGVSPDAFEYAVAEAFGLQCVWARFGEYVGFAAGTGDVGALQATAAQAIIDDMARAAG